MEQRPFSDIAYEQFLREEKLMGSKCKACDALYLPPRPICVKCHAVDMEWVEMKGEGRLAAFTCISIGPPAMIAQGYNRNNPYCSGVVELPGGVRVDARIVEVDTKQPESIQVGMPLRAAYLHAGEGPDRQTTLVFQPR